MVNVEVHIKINVLPNRVIEAFVNPELLGKWWGVERAFIEPREGGVYTLNWGISEQGIKYISTGIIASYDPEEHIHIDRYMYINPERPILGPLHLTVHASPVAGGSMVHLTQGPYPQHAGAHWDWYYKVVKEAWPKVMEGLKAHLE